MKMKQITIRLTDDQSQILEIIKKTQKKSFQNIISNKLDDLLETVLDEIATSTKAKKEKLAKAIEIVA